MLTRFGGVYAYGTEGCTPMGLGGVRVVKGGVRLLPASPIGTAAAIGTGSFSYESVFEED